MVSVYAFSAGASGLLAAGFVDRFDRKLLLLVFYGGFVAGTLMCGLVRTYGFLLFARMITGVFAGVLGSTVFAITTDLFPYQIRGRVMGILQTAFAASSVVGLPLALALSNRWGWNAPFLLIVAVAMLVGVAAMRYLRPIDSHLQLHPDRSPLHPLPAPVSVRRYLQGFAASALLATGGFMLMPYMSAYLVNNLGIEFGRLPLVYMITGACSIVAGPLIGRAADAVGKFPVFGFGCAATITMVLIYTHLGVTPLGLVLLGQQPPLRRSVLEDDLGFGTDLCHSRSGRPRLVHVDQQLGSAGLGRPGRDSGGPDRVQTRTGALEHFEVVGYVLVGTTLVTFVMMYFISRRVEGRGTPQIQ